MGAVASQSARPDKEGGAAPTVSQNGSNRWNSGNQGTPAGQFDWFNPVQGESHPDSFYSKYKAEHNGQLPVWDQNLGERYNSSTGYLDPNGDAAVGDWAAYDPNNKNTPQSPYADDPDAQRYFQFDRPAYAPDASQMTAESGFGYPTWMDPSMQPKEDFTQPGMINQWQSLSPSQLQGQSQAMDMGDFSNGSAWTNPYLQSMNLYGQDGTQNQNFSGYNPAQNGSGFSYGKLGG